MYVPERIVNIKELEDYISGAFTMVLCIQKEIADALGVEMNGLYKKEGD